MASHTIKTETAKPSSSAKRTAGARHAYLGRAGVVVVSAEGYRTALELEALETVTASR